MTKNTWNYFTLCDHVFGVIFFENADLFFAKMIFPFL